MLDPAAELGGAVQEVDGDTADLGHPPEGDALPPADQLPQPLLGPLHRSLPLALSGEPQVVRVSPSHHSAPPVGRSRIC